MHHIGEEIHFYVVVPKESVDFVSRQIEGLWKEAYVEMTDDYNIFNPAGINHGVYLKQKFSYALPIRTYIEANIDTFAPILSGLSRLNEISEGAAIQILAKPAPKSAKKSILNIIDQLKKEKNLKRLWADYRSDLKILKRRLFQKKKKKKR